MVDSSANETTLPFGAGEALMQRAAEADGSDSAAVQPEASAPAAAPAPAVMPAAFLARREPTVSESARAEASLLIERGLKAADPLEQFRCFERAHKLNMNDPTAMSLHGMALATVLHRYQEGIVFCEEAVRRQGASPALLVNLAKAFLAAKNKREAVRCLRRALARSQGQDDRARIELAALGLRRRPVIWFLPRSFFLNKILGRLRHAILERKTPADDGQRPIPAELGQLSGDLEAAQAALETGPDEHE